MSATVPAVVAESAPEAVAEVPEKKLRVLTLEANDKERIKVPEDVAFQSNLLKKMVSDLGITDPEDKALSDALPVSNVDGWTLRKILEWCETHKGEVFKPKEAHEDQRIDLTPADKAYMDITNEQLVAVLLGANYLDIPGLIEIITQKIASMSDGKSIEEIREVYCLPDDFTPEEKEALRE